MNIDLDITKSVEANASQYYDYAKKLKKKLAGASLSLAKSAEQLQKLNAQKEAVILEQAKQKKAPVQKEWYEKFRWFFSSEGFLVIGGRDATSNEIVIKKHAEKGDLVFHTDMIGSPFFVIKSDGKKPGSPTIQEAADATITFSRAFKLGRGSTPTFMARPDQLSKTAKSGEYVPKGGFITEGNLEYVDAKISLAVGNYHDHVMAGPVDAVKKHCSSYVHLKLGQEKPGRVAKQIHHKIGCTVDDISRALPTGTFSVVK